jgi:hypothetical protein
MAPGRSGRAGSVLSIGRVATRTRSPCRDDHRNAARDLRCRRGSIDPRRPMARRGGRPPPGSGSRSNRRGGRPATGRRLLAGPSRGDVLDRSGARIDRRPRRRRHQSRSPRRRDQVRRSLVRSHGSKARREAPPGTDDRSRASRLDACCGGCGPGLARIATTSALAGGTGGFPGQNVSDCLARGRSLASAPGPPLRGHLVPIGYCSPQCTTGAPTQICAAPDNSGIDAGRIEHEPLRSGAADPDSSLTAQSTIASSDRR